MNQTDDSVHDRLLDAALALFLQDEFQQVTTRAIAARAGVDVAMIRYYFGSKLGLFEEMVRVQLQPLIEVLDTALLQQDAGFANFLQLYYQSMTSQAEFPRLILKIIALNQGPGRAVIASLLSRGRKKGTEQVLQMQQRGHISAELDPDMIRLVFVSLALTPVLLKDWFEQQSGRQFDAAFFHQLAQLNGQLLSRGLQPAATLQEQPHD